MRRLPVPAVAGLLLFVSVVAAGCSGGSVSPATTAAESPSAPPAASTASAPLSTAAASTPASSTPARRTATRSTPTRARPTPTHTSAPPKPLLPDAPGALVVLNPGHNGANASHPAEINRQVPAGFGAHKECDTTGTSTNAGYPEHAYTWDVVLRIQRILRAHGVRVVLTRHSDSGVGPCVDRRAAIGNHPDVDAVVSVHGDGAPSSGHGFFVNTALRRPGGASEQVMRRNGVLARDLRDGLARHSGMTTSTYLGTNGIFATDKFAGLNLATRPAAFLEIGNMRNAGDAALQSSTSGRQQIAEGVAAGLLAYLAG